MSLVFLFLLFSLWGKGYKGVSGLWTLLITAGEEESLQDKGSIEPSSLGSYWSQEEGKGDQLVNLGTPSVVSLDLFDELVSGGDEKKEFWKKLWGYL